MVEFFKKLFDTSDYPARWFCGNWTAGEGWLHIASDITIFLAYFVIPLILVYFITRRKDIPMLPIIWLFASFIFLCGFGHLNEAIIFWQPYYRFAGLVKAATAIVSVATVFTLFKVVPQALAIPSAAKRLEKIFNNAPTPVIGINDSGHIQLSNTQFEKKFQYNTEEAKGLKADTLFQSQDHFQFAKIKKDLAKNTKLEFTGENHLICLKKDGKPFHADIFINQFKVDDENLTLVAISDISKMEEYKETITTKNHELEAINKDLDSFVHIASHDLKSPLRAIHNLSTWIQEDAEDTLPDDCKEHIESMQGRIKRMEQLLDDLLEYSRLGQKSYKATKVDTKAAVTEITQLLDIPEGFQLNVDGKFPKITTNRAPLDLVFRNLISNSIKHHNNKSSGEISIIASEEPKNYRFTVKDNGPGIEDKDLDLIFEKFQTLKSRDEVEGSGLGLSIVKKAVETHGGTISVTSTVGVGSEFSFTWPKSSI